ncbi:hypothetical protein ACQR35_08240 [Pseudarthrobacter sp. J1738]|uniref:hypothetical protein n=1 Tax=Pseudarthrobacter sp. J1738 TaxID=3420446 RepID=UPI003D2CE9D2
MQEEQAMEHHNSAASKQESNKPETNKPETTEPETNKAESGQAVSNTRNTGPGRLLIAVYGIFALAATARAGYQIATKFSEAPVAYSLSAFAAIVYIVATISLAKAGTNWFKVSLVALIVELLGVLVVGFLSIADSVAFPHQTVWSGFGQGYGYVPLLLPIIGLIWLYRRRPAAH